MTRVPIVPDRLGAAPISWGVCEVPGWGEQLPRERVLGEMAELGFVATETGALGYLGTEGHQIRAVLQPQGLGCIGGFVPLVLHEPSQAAAQLESARLTAARLAEAGCEYFITAAVADHHDWHHEVIDDTAWAHLVDRLADVAEIAAQHGLTQAVHPHVATVIETADEVDRLIAESDVAICYDTGHLFIGGVDLATMVAAAFDRIELVHLKDVNKNVADRLNASELSLTEAVQAGLFCPLGRGDVPIDEIVMSLERSGYQRWYVIEQDAALTDGSPPAGEGPIVDVRLSVDYLRSIDRVVGAAQVAS